MKKIYFTVGPSEPYPTIPKHLNSALKNDILSLNHRGGEFKKLFASTVSGLKKLLNIPQIYEVFFVSSALEAMERTIEGVVDKESFHIISGSFGSSWAKYASDLGKNAIKCHLTSIPDLSSHFQPGVVKLKDVPKEAELICLTQNDTSTGIWIPMDEIYALKKKNPEKLITIDVVSSVPYVEIDFSKIDITFFSVQKGFGLPAGLGVMIVSPKALAKAQSLVKKGKVIGSYHSLLNLSEKAKDNQTPETPNVLNIYLLDRVIKDMQKKGLAKIRKETDQKAKVLYDFFNFHPEYSVSVEKIEYRSPTTAVFNVNGKSQNLRDKLSKKGFIIGSGYGAKKDDQVRIANFPSHTLKDLQKMLDNI